MFVLAQALAGEDALFLEEIPLLPLWAWVVIGVFVALVLAAIVFFVVKKMGARPAPPPPTPQQIAIMQLDELRARSGELDAYALSIAVSDILRSYVSAQFGLRATKQTSVEFLESVRASRNFTDRDRELLADFLETCDLVKFARHEATAAESARLLDEAVEFVNQKGAAPMLHESV